MKVHFASSVSFYTAEDENQNINSRCKEKIERVQKTGEKTCKNVENRVIKIFFVKKFSYLKLLKNCAERFTTISESSETSFCDK